MANAFQAKDAGVLERQLKVQKLSIPFTLTSNATPASVVTANDEPSILFIQTQGVNNITAALAAGETATYTSTPNDANGILNLFIRTNEAVGKICKATFVSRITGVSQPAFLGSASGLSSAGNIMLAIDSSVNYATTDVDGCIEVQYVTVK